MLKPCIKMLLIAGLLLQSELAPLDLWGAKPEARSENCQALGSVSKNGDVLKVRALLQNGCDPNTVPENELTPLMISSHYGHENVTSLLLDHGARVEQTSRSGRTALMIAAENGHIAIVQVLLRNGADVNHRAKDGGTPLMSAAGGHPEILKLLLSKGAEVNAKTNRNTTALMLAAYSGNRHCVSLLLTAGADKDLRSTDGKTALTIAMAENHKEIVQQLKPYYYLRLLLFAFFGLLIWPLSRLLSRTKESSQRMDKLLRIVFFIQLGLSVGILVNGYFNYYLAGNKLLTLHPFRRLAVLGILSILVSIACIIYTTVSTKVLQRRV